MLWSLSHLIFCKIFKESFWNLFEWFTSGKQNLVKFTHLVSQEAENNNLCQTCVLNSFFKTLYIKQSISSNVTDPFCSRSTQNVLVHSKVTRGSLKRHSKGIWALDGHLDTQSTWALEHLRHSVALTVFSPLGGQYAHTRTKNNGR